MTNTVKICHGELGNAGTRWVGQGPEPSDLIAGMDFFVVPTVRFQLLYVWFAIDHKQRQILHFNVTGRPTACWVIPSCANSWPTITQPSDST
jgi:hypothetical protein